MGERVAMLFGLLAGGGHRLLVALAGGVAGGQFRRGADAFDLPGQRRLLGQGRLGGEQRELQAARSGVENEDGLHPSMASRLRWAISWTMAQDAARVSAV